MGSARALSLVLKRTWEKKSPNDSSHLKSIIAEWPQEPMCSKNKTSDLLTKYFGRNCYILDVPIGSVM